MGTQPAAQAVQDNVSAAASANCMALLLHAQRRWRNTSGSSQLRLPPLGISWPRVLGHSLNIFEPFWAAEGLAALGSAAARIQSCRAAGRGRG